MEPQEFLVDRLRRLSKANLISIIRDPRNDGVMAQFKSRNLEGMIEAQLIEIILGVPQRHIDNNVYPDYRHQKYEAPAFDRLYALAMQSKQNRLQQLQTMTKEQMIAVMGMPANGPVFSSDEINEAYGKTREQLVAAFLKYPEITLTGNPNDRSYDPEYWKPKPNQIDHIKTLSDGLQDPVNEARCVWDGSETGKGKTITTILILMACKIRNVVIVCPDAVMKKWHDALRPLGLFEYRLCTYAGIKGTEKNRSEQWAKYKPDPLKLTYSEDLPWIKITKISGKKGIHSDNYDWSYLPNTDPQTGLGGCCVVWDEVQNAKNATKTGACFNNFVSYLHAEKEKYLRGIYLSGTVMEKIEDLPYMMNALNYIPVSSKGELNSFIRTELGTNFRRWMSDDWNSEEHGKIVDGNTKLLLFLRIVAKRQKKFSQIPDALPYVVYKLGYIPHPYSEYMHEFIATVLVPNFRDMMGSAWTPELEALPGDKKLLRLLSLMANEPRFASYGIAEVVERTFDNPISFQGLQVRNEDLGQFMRINRELEAMLMEVVRGNKKFDGGVLGQIQRTLSELEVLKLTPFTELARKALMTKLPTGAEGSVVISMLRNASCRHFAWRLEAILMVEEVKKLVGLDKLEATRVKMREEAAESMRPEETSLSFNSSGRL